ncbi:H-NS histone family protein [Noviherbaspirillum pedocola]|uniref:H-NS histone family protein n=1 Tax=Noviherbaspirillum pedocola TaxID=2801341 RepID=A0A934SQM3_9BURK|nr:H-NS histone family protein [Noviherbaspirillum pedocola]MBK4733700.1 H-NS histone family protein [Noviherbaspirillum pedocola]
MTTLAELNKKIAEMQAQANKMREEGKANAIEEIKQKMEEFAITPQDLGFGHQAKAKKTKATSIPKDRIVAYKKSETETWSGGRGPKPQWVKDVISKEGIDALEKYKTK